MTFHPSTLPIPNQLVIEELLLRPLRATDNALDYEAVMATQEFLRLGTSGLWPHEGFTLEENLRDLQEHEKEHEARVSFTFTIMNRQETQCLGCLYINPLDELLKKYPVRHAFPPGCATAIFWMRPECQQGKLGLLLLKGLRDWFEEEWAFPSVVFLANRLETHHRQLYEEAGLKPILTLGTPNSLTLYG